MDSHLPLPTLLSNALVAFTIEFDNEFEHQAPHRTTNHGSTPGVFRAPWLVSMAMWLHFMQFIPDDGIPLRELKPLLRATDKSMDAWLTRMGKWWGYVVVEPSVAGSKSKRPRPDAIVRPTAGGRKALEVWRPLTAAIENRWRERFGAEKIANLRKFLGDVVSRFDVDLPDYLPILGYGLFSSGQKDERRAAAVPKPKGESESTLPVLLAKVLLAFAIEYEGESEVSLAISANVLRLAGEAGVRVRDLPRLAGVSKEAIAMSLSFLEKRGFAAVEAESPDSRIKVLALTPKGWNARDTYFQSISAIEKGWRTRFGDEIIGKLRKSLEHLVGESGGRSSPLFRGLEPYADGWRASIPRTEVLPHYPMVLHRGGFPDGS